MTFLTLERFIYSNPKFKGLKGRICEISKNPVLRSVLMSKN